MVSINRFQDPARENALLPESKPRAQALGVRSWVLGDRQTYCLRTQDPRPKTDKTQHPDPQDLTPKTQDPRPDTQDLTPKTQHNALLLSFSPMRRAYSLSCYPL